MMCVMLSSVILVLFGECAVIKVIGMIEVIKRVGDFILCSRHSRLRFSIL